MATGKIPQSIRYLRQDLHRPLVVADFLSVPSLLPVGADDLLDRPGGRLDRQGAAEPGRDVDPEIAVAGLARQGASQRTGAAGDLQRVSRSGAELYGARSVRD